MADIANGSSIIDSKSFRNEYDGHTIDQALEQVGRLYQHPIKAVVCDRGYRRQKQSGDTVVMIPDNPNLKTPNI